MEPMKTIISISEMARQVGLSRARFYQLMGSTFPWPVYSVSNRRPFYDEELQYLCLGVRRRNCGIDGKPVLFYSKRGITNTTAPIRRTKKVVPTSPPVKVEATAHEEIFDGLRGLGLLTATMAEVTAAVKELYPAGVKNENRGQVLRAVFLKIKRQNTADNVGR